MNVIADNELNVVLGEVPNARPNALPFNALNNISIEPNSRLGFKLLIRKLGKFTQHHFQVIRFVNTLNGKNKY